MTLGSFNVFTVTVTPQSVLWKYTKIAFRSDEQNSHQIQMLPLLPSTKIAQLNEMATKK